MTEMKKRDHVLFKSYGLVNDKDFEEGYKDFFEGKVTRKDITRYTRSILPYVKKVYGW